MLELALDTLLYVMISKMWSNVEGKSVLCPPLPLEDHQNLNQCELHSNWYKHCEL